MSSITKPLVKLKPRRLGLGMLIRRDWQLLLLCLIPFAYFVIYYYLPMAGIVIAFQDFSPKTTFFSPWVGFKWFTRFFNSYDFFKLIRNTFLLSIYSIFWSFPIPIIFAIMLHDIKNKWYQRTMQTFSYMPHFISMVVAMGIVIQFLSPTSGIVNTVIEFFGGEAHYFISDPKWFRTIFISSGIWQSFGFGSIIYFAAIAGVSPELYEAATIDGATKTQKIWHVTLPGISTTIIILLLLNLGSLLSVGFEKVILLYQPTTMEVADVIGSFVYRVGIQNNNFSFGAAVGLFNSVVNFTLIIVFNTLARKFGDISLW